MDVVIALHAAAAVLLLIAGVAKVARPGPTADLVETLGLPASSLGVRVLGTVELALGAAALAVGGTLIAVAVGVLYAGFGVVVVRALLVGAESCGCFGRAETPPTWFHVVGNIGFAVASFVAASAETTPVEAMEDQAMGGAPYVLLVGVIAGLAAALFTALPEAMAARKVGASGAAPFRVGGNPDSLATRRGSTGSAGRRSWSHEPETR